MSRTRSSARSSERARSHARRAGRRRRPSLGGTGSCPGGSHGSRELSTRVRVVLRVTEGLQRAIVLISGERRRACVVRGAGLGDSRLGVAASPPSLPSRLPPSLPHLVSETLLSRHSRTPHPSAWPLFPTRRRRARLRRAPARAKASTSSRTTPSSRSPALQATWPRRRCVSRISSLLQGSGVAAAGAAHLDSQAGEHDASRGGVTSSPSNRGTPLAMLVLMPPAPRSRHSHHTPGPHRADGSLPPPARKRPSRPCSASTTTASSPRGSASSAMRAPRWTRR